MGIFDFLREKRLGCGGSGGAAAQKQADWNQNDETAPDFVKGRTHYTTIGAGEVVLEKYLSGTDYDTIQFGDAYPGDRISGPGQLAVFEDGEQYHMRFEFTWGVDGANTIPAIQIGDVFEGTATAVDGKPTIFHLVNVNDSSVYYDLEINSNGSYVTHCIKPNGTGVIGGNTTISKAVEITKKLDPKFLPQPDWNANEGEAGHIANRTHYTFIEETTVVESAEYPVDAETKRIPSANRPSLTHSADPFPNVIIWNGVEYPFNRNGYFHGNEMNLYGNASLSNMKETDVVSGLDFHNGDTGEPFCFLFWNESIDSIDVNTEDDSVTFELIYRSDENVVKLDEKYIPNTIARQAAVEELNNRFDNLGSSGGTYLINYDDVASLNPGNGGDAMATYKAIWDAYYAGKVLLLKKAGKILHLVNISQPNFDYSDDFSKYEWASLTFSACHGTTYSDDVNGTVSIITFTLKGNGAPYLNDITLDLSTMIKS